MSTRRSLTRILGLDPGLQTTGYGVVSVSVDGVKVCEAGVLRSIHDKSDDLSDLPQRILRLYDGLMDVIKQWQPNALAIEELYAHYDHPRTAVLMAHARGSFLLAGAQKQIPVVSYAATRVKKSLTGHGRASKEQMQAAIMRELQLTKPPEPYDVSDALAVALCHHYATSKTLLSGNRSILVTGVNRKKLTLRDNDVLDGDE